MTLGGQDEGGAISRIALDRLPEQVKPADRVVLVIGGPVWQRAQVEIVRG